MLHDWCNKCCGMCYPVCGMVHIKEPLLLIGKSSPCGGSGFPLSLSPIELFLIRASVPRLVQQRLWYVLYCLWDGAYKRPLVLIEKSSPCGGSGFLLSLSPIELFLIPDSAPRLVQQMLWYVLSCLWDGAYKRTLGANRKE